MFCWLHPLNLKEKKNVMLKDMSVILSIRFAALPINKWIAMVLSPQKLNIHTQKLNVYPWAFPTKTEYSHTLFAYMWGKLYFCTMENKDIIVSWLYCTAKQSLSLPEQRIVLRLIEHCHHFVATGRLMKDNLCKIEHNLFDVIVCLHRTAVFERTTSFEEIKDTLIALSNKYLEIDNDEEWTKIDFITNPSYKKHSGILQFRVDNRFWDVLCDFSKGFRQLEIGTAMRLSSPYAIRMYMLMSGQKKPLYFSIEKLKNILGIAPDKYKYKHGKHRIDHLEQRVLKPCQQQLYATCPYSFTYTKVRENDSYLRSPVIGIRLFPVYLPSNRDSELEKRKLLSQISVAALPDEALHYLQDLGFTREEIQRNKPTLLAAQEALDLVEFLSEIVGRARVAKNPKGYIINAIKRKIKENPSEG